MLRSLTSAVKSLEIRPLPSNGKANSPEALLLVGSSHSVTENILAPTSKFVTNRKNDFD